MPKDTYVVHDSPRMKPKTVKVAIDFEGKYDGILPQPVTYEGMSAREFVETYVKGLESTGAKVAAVEYWVNVKADK